MPSHPQCSPHARAFVPPRGNLLTPMRRMTRRIWSLALALLLTAGASGVVLAAPLDPSGDIDAGFKGGVTTANFDTVYSFAGARAAAIQPATGKTVLAGESVDDGNHHWGMVRLNLDGTQDRTFGVGGEVKLQIGSYDIINDIAIQGDGKIVAVGFSNMASNDMSVGRFMPDGALDTSFANGGFLTVDFNRGSDATDRAFAVAIQDDGKIVVSGFSRHSGVTGDDFALVRLNSNGSFDPASALAAC